MCGVTGLVAWGQAPDRNEELVRAMTAAVRHRGPDAEGLWIGPHAALGHARLEILDIDGGAQPMLARTPTGGLVALTYCGEVYNHEEVRAVLEAAGHRFATRSDTEVVLRAYLEWGEVFVTHLRGMFAFALWDCDTQTLLLMRDRLGVKPLYFGFAGADLVFGSEIKALLAHPDMTATVGADGLGELFGLPPMTSAVLHGIEEVPPATLVRYNRFGLSRRRYWELESRPHLDNRALTVRRIRDHLERAVGEQILADVGVGALNSGGLDSSAVAALAAAASPDTLMTFDILHSGGAATASSSLHRSDDHPWALLVAEHVKSSHRTVEVSTSDLLAAASATLDAMEIPSLTPINASLWHLFHQIAPHRRVVLSGEGADEIFGGYRWHDLDSGVARPGRFPWDSTYQPLTALLTRETLLAVRPQRYARRRYLTAVEQMPALAGESVAAQRFREVKWLTIQFYLQFLLRRADRLAMAGGVEVRVPYLDHDLVQYAWNIPATMQRSRGMEKGALREAVEDLLPDQVAWRPKSGYPASVTRSYQCALWQLARDLVATPSAPVWRLVCRKKLTALLDLRDGDLSDWTPLQHVAYVLEIDEWLRTRHVTVT